MEEDNGKKKREPRLAITWVPTYEGIQRHEKMVKRAKINPTTKRGIQNTVVRFEDGSDGGGLNRIKGRKDKRDTIDPILRKGRK
jgi:hypothetical protein